MNITLFFLNFQYIPIFNILLFIKYYKSYIFFLSIQSKQCLENRVQPWVVNVLITLDLLLNIILHTITDIKRHHKHNSLRVFLKNILFYSISVSLLLEIIQSNCPQSLLLFMNPFFVVFLTISFAVFTMKIYHCLKSMNLSSTTKYIFIVFNFMCFLYTLIYILYSSVLTFHKKHLQHVMDHENGYESKWWTSQFFWWVIFTADSCSTPPYYSFLTQIENKSKEINNISWTVIWDSLCFLQNYNIFVGACTLILISYFIHFTDSLSCVGKMNLDISYMLNHLLQFSDNDNINYNILNMGVIIFIFYFQSSLFIKPIYFFLNQKKIAKSKLTLKRNLHQDCIENIQWLNNTLYTVIFCTVLGVNAYVFPYIQQILILMTFLVNWIGHLSCILTYYISPMFSNITFTNNSYP